MKRSNDAAGGRLKAEKTENLFSYICAFTAVATSANEHICGLKEKGKQN